MLCFLHTSFTSVRASPPLRLNSVLRKTSKRRCTVCLWAHGSGISGRRRRRRRSPVNGRRSQVVCRPQPQRRRRQKSLTILSHARLKLKLDPRGGGCDEEDGEKDDAQSETGGRCAPSPASKRPASVWKIMLVREALKITPPPNAAEWRRWSVKVHGGLQLCNVPLIVCIVIGLSIQVWPVVLNRRSPAAGRTGCCKAYAELKESCGAEDRAWPWYVSMEKCEQQI